MNRGSRGAEAPLLHRIKWAAEGRHAYDSEGRPIMVIRAWRIERVFDRSQVELMDGHEAPPEPPSWIAQRGNGPDGLFDAICALIEAEGFEVEHRPPVGTDDGSHGWTSYTRRVVWLRSDVDRAEAARIACHELAHIRAGHQDRDISRTQRETEADSIAYVVAMASGLSIEDSAALYVLNWSDGDSDILEAAAVTVHKTAVAILTDLEREED